MKYIRDDPYFADRALNQFLAFPQPVERRIRQESSESAYQEAGCNQILAGAVVEVSSDAPSLLVLGFHQRARQRSRRPVSIAQLIDRSRQQDYRNGDTDEIELEREHAPLRSVVGKWADPVEREPYRYHRQNQDGTACAPFSEPHGAPKYYRQR